MFFHRDIAEGPPSRLHAMPSAQPTAHHETGAFSGRVMIVPPASICFLYAKVYALYMQSYIRCIC